MLIAQDLEGRNGGVRWEGGDGYTLMADSYCTPEANRTL